MKVITTWSRIKEKDIEDRIIEIFLEESNKLDLNKKLELQIGGGHWGKNKTRLGSVERKYCDQGKLCYKVDLVLNVDLRNWEKQARQIIRHELYHIYKNDFDRIGEDFKLYSSRDVLTYFFILEPKAEMYSKLGIKL